ncbi:MAG: DUF1573 domain-containing protein [Bacteroidetes bacterium]|nr:DUF1573 domain-containing protein [Bacteroidota bacterium]
MKKVILSLGFMLSMALVGVIQAQGTTTADPTNPNAADIVFETEVIDYGTIEHNADGNREFKFKNTGKEPLIISNSTGSCGCTVPTWPKEPIKPGETASIKVHYATDRIGAFEKTVTVTSNAKTPSKVLKIKGTVKPDPTPAAPAAPVTPATTTTPETPRK